MERTPEQVAHEQAMIQKVDNLHASLAASTSASSTQETPPESKPQRPADIPEQFWDADKGQVNQEALLNAYREATAGKQGTTEATTENQDPNGKPEGDPEAAAAEAIKAAKLDMSTLEQEFTKDGKLSDATYEALAKAGVDKSVVNEFIEGRQAKVTIAVNEAYAHAGGQENFVRMAQWATANIPADEQAAFDSAMAGTAAQRKQAITALKAQYAAAVGNDPSLVTGRNGGSTSVAPFASRAEVVAAMRDSRYQNDPAYREMVARRLDAMDTF